MFTAKLTINYQKSLLQLRLYRQEKQPRRESTTSNDLVVQKELSETKMFVIHCVYHRQSMERACLMGIRKCFMRDLLATFENWLEIIQCEVQVKALNGSTVVCICVFILLCSFFMEICRLHGYDICLLRRKIFK